jgi:hypothetical protein
MDLMNVTYQQILDEDMEPEYLDQLAALTTEELALLSQKPDLELVIRRDIVMSPQASPETLDALADGLDISGKAQIAYRPYALRSTLDRLATCTNTTLRLAILRNPGAGPSGETIAYLAMSSNAIVQELAVSHRNAPKRLIELALNSPDPAIRTYVVYNPRITVRELEWLARDKDERVAKAAKERLLSVLDDSMSGEKLC